jgi:mutator protein MutT
MKQTTLVFLRNNEQLLLAMKKRGLGVHKWNGVGGKVGLDESIEEAARRECQEEIGVVPGALEKVAELSFFIPSVKVENFVTVYIAREWEGEPRETEEMQPQWFALTDIPYDQMWADDALWLPQVLDNEKLIARFVLGADEQIIEQQVECGVTFAE